MSARLYLRSARLYRLRTSLRAAGLYRLRSGLMSARLCLRSTSLSLRSTSLGTNGLRSARLSRLRSDSKAESSLRHHAEAAALSAASGYLPTSALRSSASAKALTTCLWSDSESGLRTALSTSAKGKSLLSALHHTKTTLAALESSGLLSAKGCLCIHDSGRSDSGEKDSGDCKCKNLVHSSLLILCCLHFSFLSRRTTVPSL
ncbi:MAG: hypothetical protein IKL85_02425 [Lentisphaeria bacterium]|nr:hypothetical protein [Lentisphaeria bacterium]